MARVQTLAEVAAGWRDDVLAEEVSEEQEE